MGDASFSVASGVSRHRRVKDLQLAVRMKWKAPFSSTGGTKAEGSLDGNRALEGTSC